MRGVPGNNSGIDLLKGWRFRDDLHAVTTAPWPPDEPVVAAVGSFRVVSGLLGQRWAEFEVVVSSGARQQFVWRSLDDFARLAETVGLRRRAETTMPNAYLMWNTVQQQRRWWNATEAFFLVAQRAALDVFFEHFLYELDAPTQLFNFVDDQTWHLGATTRAAMAAQCCELHRTDRAGGSS
jgi:hypothetical protein